MTSRSGVLRAALCVAVILLVAVGARADFVTIGNPGNDAASAANTTHGLSAAYNYGAVPYTYQISRTAVSIAEWEAFYTAPNSGKVGTFNSTYNYWNDGGGDSPGRSVGPDAPAIYISFNQVAQYVNWLTTGDATQGAYTIDAGGAVTGIMSRADILATGQQYYLIPTEDEWYKAAYYKPDGSGYSLYAHGLDTVPPQSDGTTPYTGWNYYDGGYALPSPNWAWTVDSGTEEQNGALNMMGNVLEWNEAISGSSRGLRGGSYLNVEDYLRASSRYGGDPSYEFLNAGVRVASIIPEPASATMLLMGAVGLLLWRRRRTA
jgi:formylglycine-generating enzyme